MIPNKTMPILFLGHGNPMNAITENEFTEGWKKAAESIPKPESILCISAHWETNGTFVTSGRKPLTIHDFGGFSKELFEVKYPAPGNPDLANETRSIIKGTAVRPDDRRGFDHGCWSVLKRMYPDADVPIVQLSLDYYKPAAGHYQLAKELYPLRRKGVLVIGSGNIVHNLGLVAWDRLESGFGYDWAIAANENIKEHIVTDNLGPLIDYKAQGRSFNLAIPTPEHFLPLLYILALKQETEKISIFNDKPVAGSLSMTCIRIG